MQKGALGVLGCYVFWGMLPIFWKQLDAVNSIYILGCRIVWSVVFAVLLLALRRNRFAEVRAILRDKPLCKRLTLAGITICINWGMYIWAVTNGHIIDASLAYYLSPILTILLGTVVCREKLSRIQWTAVAIALAGIVIAVIRYRRIPWVALIIGGTFALYSALKKTVHTDSVAAVFAETLVLAPFALLLLLWMEVQGTGAIGVLHGWQWGLIPLAGVVTTVPLMLFSAGIQTTSMTLAGILTYVSPTLQLLISVLLYQEEFTTTHAILFGFVWSGLVLYLVSGFLQERKHKNEEDTLCA